MGGTLINALRDGLCVEGQRCKVCTAESGCDCAKIADHIERLHNSLAECLPLLGWASYSDAELEHEHSLGNDAARIILKARSVLGARV